jgi:hypothetical protein
MLNVMRQMVLPYRGPDAGRIILRALNYVYLSQNIGAAAENFI